MQNTWLAQAQAAANYEKSRGWKPLSEVGKVKAEPPTKERVLAAITAGMKTRIEISDHADISPSTAQQYLVELEFEKKIKRTKKKYASLWSLVTDQDSK